MAKKNDDGFIEDAVDVEVTDIGFEFDADALAQITKASEKVIIPENIYRLRCAGFSLDDFGQWLRSDKNGNPFCMLLLEVVDNKKARDIELFMGLPSPTRKKANMENVAIELRAIYAAFGVTLTTKLTPATFLGKTANGKVTVFKDEKYGEKNVVDVKYWRSKYCN